VKRVLLDACVLLEQHIVGLALAVVVLRIPNQTRRGFHENLPSLIVAIEQAQQGSVTIVGP
jgi:hypothetical protein